MSFRWARTTGLKVSAWIVQLKLVRQAGIGASQTKPAHEQCRVRRQNHQKKPQPWSAQHHPSSPPIVYKTRQPAALTLTFIAVALFTIWSVTCSALKQVVPAILLLTNGRLLTQTLAGALYDGWKAYAYRPWSACTDRASSLRKDLHILMTPCHAIHIFYLKRTHFGVHCWLALPKIWCSTVKNLHWDWHWFCLVPIGSARLWEVQFGFKSFCLASLGPVCSNTPRPSGRILGRMKDSIRPF